MTRPSSGGALPRATIRLALAVALAAVALLPRAARGEGAPPLQSPPEAAAHAAIKDAARALGWGDVPVKTLSHAYFFGDQNVTGTVVLERVIEERVISMTLKVIWLRELNILRGPPGELLSSALGQCSSWESPTSFHGMRGCAWKGGEGVAWHLERQGRPVAAFRVLQIRCLTEVGSGPLKGRCTEDPQGGLKLAQALHEAAERHGLYGAEQGAGKGAAEPLPPEAPEPAEVESALPRPVEVPRLPDERFLPSPVEPRARVERRDAPAAPRESESAPADAIPDETTDSGDVPAERDEPTPGEAAAGTVGAGLVTTLGAWFLSRVASATSGVAALPEGVATGEVEAAAALPADDLGAVAGEVARADARLAARRAAIEQRQREIEALEEELRQDQERLGADAVAVALQAGFKESQERLYAEGYRVVNPGYDFALPVQAAIDPLAAVGFYGSQAVESAVSAVTGEPAAADATKPVRCQQAGDLGVEDARRRLRDLLGDGADDALVDLVEVDVQRQSTVGGAMLEAVDCIRPRNHVATRVILPDGRRYVLDYWEALRGGERQMIPESDWRERWRERLGEDMVCKGSGDLGRQYTEERAVSSVQQALARGDSREAGLAAFREKELAVIAKHPIGEADKVRLRRQLETLVRSYRKAGSFKDVR